MYILFPILFVLMIICSLLFHFRKKRIICKICCMPVCEKICRLNNLLEPFGFRYEVSQDIFTSREDAMQREYGYCSLYDRSAAHFNMVFDCEPIYFDYDGRTWLLEFWKGQYGINIGGEVGLYVADTVISREQRNITLFHSIPNENMPLFSMALYRGVVQLYHIRQRRHWWLTGFCMGQYSEPELLRMELSVTFRDFHMMHAFINGMDEAGYIIRNLNLCNTSVTFSFDIPHFIQPRRTCSFLSAWAMFKNRLFLRLYCHTTKPFCLTYDKLLYLYEYLPHAFRHMMHIHSYKRPKRRKSR